MLEIIFSSIQWKRGPKSGARAVESAPAMRLVRGKYEVPREATAGQKQYELAEQMVVLACP
jgi:hypothetical protein